MFLDDTIKIAYTNLRARKLRSFLTMLGIIIGISSVIIITSAIAGAESLITNQIDKVGTNIVGVLPGKADESGPPAAAFGIVITTLKDSDTEAIKTRVPHVITASSYVTLMETAHWQNQKTTASIYGVSPDYPNLSDSPLESGNFFTEQDKNGFANVAVIGSQIKDDLFNGIEPLGEKIKIKQNTFTIIGVFEPIGTSGFQNVDNMIFLPVSTVQKKLLGINHIGFLRARIDASENIDQAIIDIENLLRARHHIRNPEKDDFSVRSTASALDMLAQIRQYLQFFLIAIVTIALIVGGIGIMNIMLAAVTERIREIGLRKAVGAKKSQIVQQFLIETIVISLLGAIIGIIIGIAFSYLISIIVNHLNYDWDFVITLNSLMLACGMSIAIGLVFGLYPAKKAAKLDAITALRYE